MLNIINKFYENTLSYSEKRFFYTLSIFDKWLSEEECLNYVMSFSEVDKDIIKYLEYKNYEDRIIQFLFEIYKDYDIDIYDSKTKTKTKITDFTDLEVKLIYALREKNELVIIVESIRFLLFSNYDLTLPVYIDSIYLEYIEMLAKKNNIFILN